MIAILGYHVTKRQRETFNKEDMKMEIFGRINEDGNVAVLHCSDGSVVTRLDATIYPVGSKLSARYEHPQGIVITLEDAARLELTDDNGDLLKPSGY